MKEHLTDSIGCWCHPDRYDGVVVHRDNLEYALFELALIVDILVDYDGYRAADGLKKLFDEIQDIARHAVSNCK